jgi:predicted nucleic acid-binding protein
MKRPLIYIDTCCFGAATHRTKESLAALTELKVLLFHVQQGTLRFAFSGWLDAEIEATRPIGKLRTLRKLLPRIYDADVPLSPEVRVEAKRWTLNCGFEETDALHIASALDAGAVYLITFDADFHEKARQCKLLGGRLKVIWLLDCLTEVLHGKAAH